MVPAVLGSARLANFRLAYIPSSLSRIRSARISILLNGTEINSRVRVGSLTIRDVINDTPNSCDFRVDGTAPAVGDDVRILLGTDARLLLFNGELQTIDLSYEGRPVNWVWRCSAIDDTAKLNQVRPFGAYSTQSATTVAQSLITNFAPGFTATHVQAALPNISVNFDSTEGFSGALKQIAKLIGGYFYVEDMDLHLFQVEVTDAPDPIDVSHPPLNDPPITISTDYSQLRTRVYGKGGGVGALIEIPPGETILPVQDVGWYDAAGGRVVAPGTQRLTYTGVTVGGVGGLVGPGASPSGPPSVTPTPGTGVDLGVHKYAYTSVTASGESLPSPLTTVTLGPLPTLTGQPAANFTSNASFPTEGVVIPGGTQVGYAFSLADVGAVARGPLGTFTTVTAPGTHGYYVVTFTVTSAMVGYLPVIARRDNAGTAYGVGVGTIVTAGDVGTMRTVNDTHDTAAHFGGGIAYTTNPLQQASVAGVAVGQSSVTSRKLYRTAAGGSQLKLVSTGTTFSNNTFTGPFSDTGADSGLGANAPTIDASGLSQPSGQSLAGSSTLIVAGTGPFDAGGGWAIIGNGQQIIRYTGKSDTALTGIPASGTGSITASISWNSAITVAPSLTGIPASGAGSIVYTIKEGDPVNIWVQRDDLTAQGLYGIHEGPPLVDERRASPSLIARCDAELALYANPIQTVPYATRDVKTKSGKTVTITLTSPPISATLVIQDVTISELGVTPGLLPKFTVTASSVRFSLEDVLRRAAAEQES